MITEQPGTDELLSRTGIEKKYAGNPWTSITTITIIVVIPLFTLLFLFTNAHKNYAGYLIGGGVFMLVTYLAGSLHMNYFIVRTGELLIKNHYSPDELTIVPFEEIVSIELISGAGFGLCLQLNLSNGDTEIHEGQSLSKKHWRALRDALLEQGIKFRDDDRLLRRGF